MSTFQVKKAVRQRRPLKCNIEGLSGSGKTFTALRLAFCMRRAGIGKRIVVADSENESAGLYAGMDIDGERWEYDVACIPPAQQNPEGYTACYRYLVSQGYDIIIMDSLSHAWHGALEKVDQIAAQRRGDKFSAWGSITPAQREMLATLTDTSAHLIATMRVKSEYDRVQGSNGKETIRKIGVKADQREGAEYEFDCVVRMDQEHQAVVEKIRGCVAMDGKVASKPGPDYWKPLLDWWLTGADMPASPPPPASPQTNGYAAKPAAVPSSTAKTADPLAAERSQIAAELKRVGMVWVQLIARLNNAVHARYPETSKLADLDPSHRAWMVKELAKLPSQQQPASPPPPPPAPSNNGDPAESYVLFQDLHRQKGKTISQGLAVLKLAPETDFAAIPLEWRRKLVAMLRTMPDVRS